MSIYRITCKEEVIFVKEVEAKSEDEAKKKLEKNVNGFKTFSEWTEAWEINDIEEKDAHSKTWANVFPTRGVRKK
tara:strand:- start:14746 stop:14970 length:225 start_codon:yes stop_codon:yes gene_type:complete